MKTWCLETDAFTAQYDYLWQLSDDRWAWEYARRSARFRECAAALCGEAISERAMECANIRLLKSRVPQTRAEQLGLVFLPDPARNALEADVVWTRQAFPDQIEGGRWRCACRAASHRSGSTADRHRRMWCGRRRGRWQSRSGRSRFPRPGAPLPLAADPARSASASRPTPPPVPAARALARAGSPPRRAASAQNPATRCR